MFARPEHEKRARCGPVGTSEGYSAASDGVHECFEVKTPTMRTRAGPGVDRTAWPPPGSPETSEGVTQLYDALNAVARAVLAAVERRLDLPPETAGGLAALLDENEEDDGVRLTAMRLLHYDRLETHAPGAAQAKLGAHTDSSFLTVAPRSSAPGLEVAAYRPGPPNGWLDVENAMTAGDACVFVGDALARLTWNYFPAALHRPSVGLMLEAGAREGSGETARGAGEGRGKIAEGRISCPFFLRPRGDATLDTLALRSPLIRSPPALAPLLAWDLERNVDGVRSSWPWKARGGANRSSAGSNSNRQPGADEYFGGGHYDDVAFVEEETVVEVWDGEGEARRLLGTVRVPEGTSPEAYVANARRTASRLRGGEAQAPAVDSNSNARSNASAATAFWRRMATVATAGSDRRRLHLRPWSPDAYVACAALRSPAAFARPAEPGAQNQNPSTDCPMPAAKHIPAAVELLDSDRPMAMREWRDDPDGGGAAGVCWSGDRPARDLLPAFAAGANLDDDDEASADPSDIPGGPPPSLYAPGEWVEDVGEDAPWTSRVRCHPAVVLTDMYEDAAAEAVARAAAASLSSDSDSNDDDDDNEGASERAATCLERRARDAAARGAWNEGRVSLSFAPRHTHRAPAHQRADHTHAAAASAEDDVRFGRWAVCVEGTRLCVTCEASEWRDALAADGPDPSRRAYPHHDAFLSLPSAAVVKLRAGDGLFVPAGYVAASFALSPCVTATRRVVTVGAFAATVKHARAEGGSGANEGGSGPNPEPGRLEFEPTAALRAHAKRVRGEERAAAMVDPACGVTSARFEKYAEAVELLWACT